MATIYTLLCKSGDSVMSIIITDSLNPLPGSDTWRCDPTDALSANDGTIGSWGTEITYLSAGAATPIVDLHAFKKSTKIGDQGAGYINDIDGEFPSGEFTWKCTEKV